MTAPRKSCKGQNWTDSSLRLLCTAWKVQIARAENITVRWNMVSDKASPLNKFNFLFHHLTQSSRHLCRCCQITSTHQKELRLHAHGTSSSVVKPLKKCAPTSFPALLPPHGFSFSCAAHNYISLTNSAKELNWQNAPSLGTIQVLTLEILVLEKKINYPAIIVLYQIASLLYLHFLSLDSCNSKRSHTPNWETELIKLWCIEKASRPSSVFILKHLHSPC